MASLRAHFVRSDEHDRLRFHPQCPQCRAERLEGTLQEGSLVPLRVQAAIAVGVLASASIAPTSAFAAGVDDEIEGTAAPGQLTPDIDADGELDAGDPLKGEPTDAPAPFTATMPIDETSDEPTPESQTTEPAVSEPEVSGTVPDVREQEPVGFVDAAAAAPSTEREPAAEPAAGEVPANRAEKARARSRARAKDEMRRVKRTAEARVVNQEVPVLTVAAPAPVVATAPTLAVATAPASQTRRVVAVAASSARAAKPGDETHVVQRGESLWSIAADVLDEDASPMRVAREVNRLWELNQSRIGTGDRDLLMAGTRLVL